MSKWRQLKRGVLVVLVLSLCWVAGVSAAQYQSKSTNFQVNEVFFGSGGSLNSCSSGTYCAKLSAGETAVGNTSSSNFQAQGGFNTDRSPSLQFIISTSTINMGVLQPGLTYSATAGFSVKTYLSSDYVVQTVSDPPRNGAHVLDTFQSPYTSNPNSEQFGINLVKNTSCGNGLPSTLGADPVQIPDSRFSFGAAATGYDSPCHFRYQKGDVIAHSNKSTGETDYTISYVFNISDITPGGAYTMNQVLVATPTY